MSIFMASGLLPKQAWSERLFEVKKETAGEVALPGRWFLHKAVGRLA
jgi:hypothetical protein